MLILNVSAVGVVDVFVDINVNVNVLLIGALDVVVADVDVD